MPRAPRTRSKSGIYHIVMRGINRQTIFEDIEDCQRFLDTLMKYKEICGYKLYSYCLMGNHLHLLLKEGTEPLEQVMRRICGSYVYWYNQKYDRIGYLFQDRYKSEPVEDDAYFLTVLRYILQNPLKAGLSVNINDYRWSNYKDFNINNTKTEISYVLNFFGKNSDKALKAFSDFLKMPSEDNCLELKRKPRITDESAKQIIQEVCGVLHTTDIQKLEITTRNSYIKILKEEHGLSIRQIERLTGINRGIVARL